MAGNDASAEAGKPESEEPKPKKTPKKRASKKRTTAKKKAAPKKKTAPPKAVKPGDASAGRPEPAVLAAREAAAVPKEPPVHAEPPSGSEPATRVAQPPAGRRAPTRGAAESVAAREETGPMNDSPESSEAALQEMANFRQGFLQSIDYLLHHPRDILGPLQRDVGLWDYSRFFVIVTVALSAIYGAVMGATNLLQGSTMGGWGKLTMIIVTAIKVPLLFLLTLAVVLPAIYLLNTWAGARLKFRQMVALGLASMALTATALASMSTVAFFFALTSGSYHFIKVLHVLIFIYAGAWGLAFLIGFVREVTSEAGGRTPNWLLIIWLLLYMFVGTQLAWALRPYVGSPAKPFQLLRKSKEGSFLKSVGNSIIRHVKE